MQFHLVSPGDQVGFHRAQACEKTGGISHARERPTSTLMYFVKQNWSNPEVRPIPCASEESVVYCVVLSSENRIDHLTINPPCGLRRCPRPRSVPSAARAVDGGRAQRSRVPVHRCHLESLRISEKPTVPVFQRNPSNGALTLYSNTLPRTDGTSHDLSAHPAS